MLDIKTPDTNTEIKKPLSEAQLAANRANAQKSTGPKTEEGKAASRENAIKHGLCSRRTILPCEDKAEYARIHADFIADCQPVGQREVALVGHIMAAHWSMTRAQALECYIFDMEIEHYKKTGGCPDPSSHTMDYIALALGFLRQPETHMRSFFRYSSQSERAFYRALRELREMQNDRLRREQLLPKGKHAQQPEPEPDEPVQSIDAPKVRTAGGTAKAQHVQQTKTPQPEIGFVAQNTINAQPIAHQPSNQAGSLHSPDPMLYLENSPAEASGS